jgi:hypothetical protein
LFHKRPPATWCSCSTQGDKVFYFRNIEYNIDTHNIHAYSPLWTHVHKTLPLWIPPKDWAPDRSRDFWSHH